MPAFFRYLWSRAARRLGRFCLPRGAARAYAVGAKRLRTPPRRAVAPYCSFLADLSVLEHNGQTVLSRICSSAVGLKKAAIKGTLRGAAATVQACRAVIFALRRCSRRAHTQLGAAGFVCAANRQSDFEKKLPRRRASALLPLDAATRPRSAPRGQKNARRPPKTAAGRPVAGGPLGSRSIDAR